MQDLRMRSSTLLFTRSNTVLGEDRPRPYTLTASKTAQTHPDKDLQLLGASGGETPHQTEIRAAKGRYDRKYCRL